MSNIKLLNIFKRKIKTILKSISAQPKLKETTAMGRIQNWNQHAIGRKIIWYNKKMQFLFNKISLLDPVIAFQSDKTRLY